MGPLAALSRTVFRNDSLPRSLAIFCKFELPFFPTILGKTVDKAKVVETFQNLHFALNFSYLRRGRDEATGCMRLAGARLYYQLQACVCTTWS